MPKGVEHNIETIKLIFPSISVESLMPKGVEHLYARRIAIAQASCVESLMPKGVEHIKPISNLSAL